MCSGKIVAPLGVDLITLQLEDKKNRVLSRGSATVLVFKTNGNLFDFTLDGVPASVALVPESNVLAVVPASNGYVNFEARDADGRIITPDGHYTDANGNALVFDLKSTNKSFHLASTTVSAPGMPIPFRYDGTQHVGTFALTPSAHKGVKTSVAFHPSTVRFVPGIALRVAPPIPIQVMSATQVPFASTAGFDPNSVFVLGNSGGQSAALAFNIASASYGIGVGNSTGAPFQSPPIDWGGTGFEGYLEYGNNTWGYENIAPSIATVFGGGTANPCSFSTPIGEDGAGTLFCQTAGFPGGIYDSTHGATVAFGQDRKIETIGGVDYFVTVEDVNAATPGLNVYAAGSTTSVAGATSVGANVTQSTTAYYGDSDGTVRIVGGSTVATFSNPVRGVIGNGSSLFVYERGGIFGTSNTSGTFESQALPIGNVVEVVTGVNGAPMLVEADGTLDVMGI